MKSVQSRGISQEGRENGKGTSQESIVRSGIRDESEVTKEEMIENYKRSSRCEEPCFGGATRHLAKEYDFMKKGFMSFESLTTLQVGVDA